MIVGQNVAVSANDDAGAGSAAGLGLHIAERKTRNLWNASLIHDVALGSLDDVDIDDCRLDGFGYADEGS